MREAEGQSLLRELVAAVDAREPVVVATVVETHRAVPRHAGCKMLVHADGRCSGSVGGGEMEARVLAEAKEAMADGRPRLLRYSFLDPGAGDPGACGGDAAVSIEPYLPEPTVLVVGCGHVGRAVVELADWLGLRVVAVDDRAELLAEPLVPGADLRLPGAPTEALTALGSVDGMFAVLATRDTEVDVEWLPSLLAGGARWIGVIGSRRRWRRTRSELAAHGESSEELDRIASPIGLDIHAETPREIAVAIIGQIIDLLRGGADPSPVVPPAVDEDERALLEALQVPWLVGAR
jgi:xanthine dehydrogenase accessory factor